MLFKTTQFLLICYEISRKLTQIIYQQKYFERQPSDQIIRSVIQLCLTLCDPMNSSTPGLPVHQQLPEFTQTHPSSQWCHPAISSSVFPFSSCPIPPSIRVFSNESTLCIRWPKYWSFSFGIIPSKEHPGLISFRMDRLDLLAVQGTQAAKS